MGKVTDEAHEWAKETFLKTLRAARPLDGLFLQLHGTAASDSIEDCEGNPLAAIRGLVGPKVLIIASLDGHANVTPMMVQQATMPIGVKKSPLRFRADRPARRARDGGDC
jgi:microcystin degradation protein MlrC